MKVQEQEFLEESEDTQHGRFLTFALGEEVFGIEIRFVTEIVGMQPITVLPEVPAHIRGIINLRGRIITVIDVRMRFGMKEEAYTDRTCIIVVDIGDITAGLIVDNVAEVLSIQDDAIVPPPESSGINHSYLKGIGKVEEEVKLLLDCEKLFLEEELEK